MDRAVRVLVGGSGAAMSVRVVIEDDRKDVREEAARLVKMAALLAGRIQRGEARPFILSAD